MSSVSAIVLAAGQGTPMRSSRPKPLHVVCGRPMLLYVLDSLAEVDADRVVVVVGHGAEAVTKRLYEDGPDVRTDFVEQEVRRGTGDAVRVGLTAFVDEPLDDDDDAALLVLPGDTPLLRPATIAALVAEHRANNAACTLLTARHRDPTGYGRIVRGRDDRVERIVEQADATAEERAIDEVNTAVYCFRQSLLAPALRRVSPENAQGELYLTDVIEVLQQAGYPVASMVADDAGETAGINDRAQLAAAEAVLRRRTAENWMRRGVTMVDPDHTYVDTTVELAADVTLLPGTLLQGRTIIGEGCEIGPDTRLDGCVVAPGAVVQYTVAADTEIGAGAVVGPFAHLDGGASVESGRHTGPFYTGGAASS